jgi:DNA-binding NtrC family response regulator
MAVRATRLGAIDFLEKPLSTEKLLVTVENTVKLSRLEDENRRLKQRAGKQELVWKSAVMQQVMAKVERVAASETRVCILGETGTGKELVARTLHEKSSRRSGPFVTLNCAAVPAELIESELFGHEKGAFTGATTRHLGKFEQAHGGTLFLDEIGDMPAIMQAKLLRVLEQKEVERIGGDHSIQIDVRVIVATHRNLDELVRKGEFRQDLYHRIFVFPINLPPLRDRRGDIPLLARFFVSKYNERYSRDVRLMESGVKAMEEGSWPGNVRQLQHLIERLVILVPNSRIDDEAVRDALEAADARDRSAETLADAETEQIRRVLAATSGNKSRAAQILGIERKTLYRKLERMKL